MTRIKFFVPKKEHRIQRKVRIIRYTREFVHVDRFSVFFRAHQFISFSVGAFVETKIYGMQEYVENGNGMKSNASQTCRYVLCVFFVFVGHFESEKDDIERKLKSFGMGFECP